MRRQQIELPRIISHRSDDQLLQTDCRQIRDATLKVITERGGPLAFDALLERQFNGSDYI